MTLVPLISDLDSLIANSKALLVQFKGKSSTSPEEILSAESVLDHANRTVTHAAAVNLVEELSTEEDVKEQAQVLLANSCGEIKGPLLEKLTKLSRS